MWDKALAKEFKRRNNPKLIGACIGIVHSVEPFKASVYDGQIRLDAQNTYICNGLLGRESDYTLTGTHTQNGTIRIGESRSYTASGEITIEGKVSLKKVLQENDYVFVVPTADNQKFFVVDIIKGVV